MSSLATMTVVGFLGSDPESKQTKTGTQIVSASVAYDHGWGDNKKTVWCRLAFFGKAADAFFAHAKKGACVAVTGTPHVYAYKDREGEARAQLELAVDRWSFAGKKADAPAARREEPTSAVAGTSAEGDDGVPF